MILRRCTLLLLAATAAFVHAGRIAASNAATGKNQTQLARSGSPLLGYPGRTTRALNHTLGAAAPPPNHWKAEAQRKANLRSRLQAKADGFQKDQKRSLAAISSDDVRREAEDVSIEEELLISQFISTPDLSLFGGVSGITYDDDEKEYLAVTNDVRYRPSLLDSLLGRQGNATGNHTNAVVVPANETDPVGTPRWYTIDFKDGVANITNVTYLRNPDTLHYFYQSGNVSVQAIAYCEDMIYVALDKGPTSPKDFRPLIVEYNRTGHVMGTFRYPDWFNFSSRGFTGLTINPNEHRLYAATGDALMGDGKGSIRITEFDLSTRESGRQYVYEADLEHVVGLVSIDENGGFLVLERSNAKAEYNPSIGHTATVPPVVGRSQPGSWYGYDVYLYYALCLDALNVQNVSSGLEGFSLNTMRKDLIQEWNNVTKFEAIGPAGSHSTYRRPTSPSKSAGKGKGRGPAAAKKTHSDSSRRRRRHRGLSSAKETSEQHHRHLKDDSIDMILVADNEFVRDTEVQFLEVDIHEVPLLKAAEETEDLLSDGGGEEADTRAKDPAIWVHPSEPEHSLIIGAMAKGLVQVYDLEGNLKQTVNNGNEASGVDVMYSFKLADNNLVDIAIVSDRAGNKIEAYKITYEDSNNNNILSGISEGLPSIGSPSGLATYTSPFTGKSFVFVLENNNQIKQVALKSTSGNQRVGGDIVRTIPLPASAGGLVVDQELGYLYVSLKDDNDKGIIKYDAEVDEYRDNDNFPETIVDGDRSFFKGSDIEGITLYYGDQGDGYLVVSIAGDSTFAVFERESDHDYYDSFTIGHNDKDDIDRVDRTEGVAITNVYLGSEFKCGVFVASDIDNEEVLINEDNDGALVNGNTNFKLVPFEELAEKLYYYLDVDTDSWDPRRFALVIWINCIAQDVYSALNEGKLSGRDTEKLLFYLNEATRHTYPRASKKQQMISRLNPFEYDDRRRSLEDRRLESRRRYEQDQQQRSRELPGKKKKEEKRGDCRRRRRLGVDTGKARDDLDDFIDRLQTLRDAGRLNDVGDDRYNHWKDLANGVKDQLHDDR